MSQDPDVGQLAGSLRASLGLLRRRLRQTSADGELSMPETSALARLDRGGPATSSALARQEQISPQSMGATIAALEAGGLVERRPDPADGRRAVMHLTGAGLQVVRNRRNASAERMAQALAAEFTPEELSVLTAAAPLLERLAQRI
jgi:DNA-binding MarR family transcriptional regulator